MDTHTDADDWMVVRSAVPSAGGEAEQAATDQQGEPKLPLGPIWVTPSIVETFHDDFTEILAALRRHERADWGAVSEEDAAENDKALKSGERILSAYETRHGTIWVITEADRSATTVLLPAEY